MVDAVEQNMFSEPAYRGELAARLTAAGLSRPDEDVRVISTRFFVQKKSSSGASETSWCRMGPSGRRLSAQGSGNEENVSRAKAFIASLHRRIGAAEKKEALKDCIKQVPGLHSMVRAVKRLKN